MVGKEEARSAKSLEARSANSFHSWPVSLRQYELVYSILARKQEFLVNF